VAEGLLGDLGSHRVPWPAVCYLWFYVDVQHVILGFDVKTLRVSGADLMWCGDVAMFGLDGDNCWGGQGSKFQQIKVLSKSVSNYSTIRLQIHVILRLGAVVLVWFLHIKHPWIPKSVWHKWTYVMYCPSSSTLRDASLWGRLRLRQCSSVQAQASGESLWEIIHKTKPTPEKTSKSKIKCLCPT